MLKHLLVFKSKLGLTEFIYFMNVLPRQFQSIEYSSGNSVSVRQPPVKKKLAFNTAAVCKYNINGAVKLRSLFSFIQWAYIFDFMNPIQQKSTVLIKTFETMIFLASNIVLQACQLQ